MSDDDVTIERDESGEEVWLSMPHHTLVIDTCDGTGRGHRIEVYIEPASDRLAAMVAKTLREWSATATEEELAAIRVMLDADDYSRPY